MQKSFFYILSMITWNENYVKVQFIHCVTARGHLNELEQQIQHGTLFLQTAGIDLLIYEEENISGRKLVIWKEIEDG